MPLASGVRGVTSASSPDAVTARSTDGVATSDRASATGSEPSRAVSRNAVSGRTPAVVGFVGSRRATGERGRASTPATQPSDGGVRSGPVGSMPEEGVGEDAALPLARGSLGARLPDGVGDGFGPAHPAASERIVSATTMRVVRPRPACPRRRTGRVALPPMALAPSGRGRSTGGGDVRPSPCDAQPKRAVTGVRDGPRGSPVRPPSGAAERPAPRPRRSAPPSRP